MIKDNIQEDPLTENEILEIINIDQDNNSNININNNSKPISEIKKEYTDIINNNNTNINKKIDKLYNTINNITNELIYYKSRLELLEKKFNELYILYEPRTISSITKKPDKKEPENPFTNHTVKIEYNTDNDTYKDNKYEKPINPFFDFIKYNSNKLNADKLMNINQSNDNNENEKNNNEHNKKQKKVNNVTKRKYFFVFRTQIKESIPIVFNETKDDYDFENFIILKEKENKKNKKVDLYYHIMIKFKSRRIIDLDSMTEYEYLDKYTRYKNALEDLTINNNIIFNYNYGNEKSNDINEILNIK